MRKSGAGGGGATCVQLEGGVIAGRFDVAAYKLWLEIIPTPNRLATNNNLTSDCFMAISNYGLVQAATVRRRFRKVNKEQAPAPIATIPGSGTAAILADILKFVSGTVVVSRVG